jgi:hypothetical protein
MDSLHSVSEAVRSSSSGGSRPSSLQLAVSYIATVPTSSPAYVILSLKASFCLMVAVACNDTQVVVKDAARTAVIGQLASVRKYYTQYRAFLTCKTPYAVRICVTQYDLRV